METPFSHYKSMGNVLDVQGQLRSQWSDLAEILCMSSLPASIKRIGSKATEKRWRHHFPIISQWGGGGGAFLLPWTPEFESVKFLSFKGK